MGPKLRLDLSAHAPVDESAGIPVSGCALKECYFVSQKSQGDSFNRSASSQFSDFGNP